ncbi:MAG: hypothetical protein NTX61_02205 [Bacteroidetes bacterium]|nr:hypothetical protein [Bacteroidota bacterium]
MEKEKIVNYLKSDKRFLQDLINFHWPESPRSLFYEVQRQKIPLNQGIQLLMLGIPDFECIYKDGQKVYQERLNSLGLPEPADFIDIFNELISITYKCQTMIEFSEKLKESKSPLMNDFYDLIQRIPIEYSKEFLILVNMHESNPNIKNIDEIENKNLNRYLLAMNDSVWNNIFKDVVMNDSF